jgi:hypothetical protein
VDTERSNGWPWSKGIASAIHVKSEIAYVELNPVSQLCGLIDLVGIYPKVKAVRLDREDSVIKDEGHLPHYVEATDVIFDLYHAWPRRSNLFLLRRESFGSNDIVMGLVAPSLAIGSPDDAAAGRFKVDDTRLGHVPNTCQPDVLGHLHNGFDLLLSRPTLD